MISDEVLEKVTERVIQRLQKLNTDILKQIGSNLDEIGKLKPSKAQQLAQMLKYGGDYDKIVKELSKVSKLNTKEIKEIFEEVSKNDYRFAKQFYDYRGIGYIPYDENVALKNQVQAIANITAKRCAEMMTPRALGFGLINKKTGNIEFKGLKQAYYDLLDEAVLSVSQGKESFDQAMTRQIKQMGSGGLKVIYDSTYINKEGKEVHNSRRLDSAIRMNLKDSLRELHNETQDIFGKEFGANMVEVSHHSNSAPDHIDTIDGKQFAKIDVIKEQIKNGIEKKIRLEDIQGNRVRVKGKWYDDFDTINNSLDRQVSTLNCYHYIFNGILGVTEPEYTKEELQKDKEKNLNGCEIDGKHYTLYEGTQMQRQLETKIREQKDIQIMARASGQKEVADEAQKKITQLTDKYNELSKKANLPTKKQRLKVAGYHKIKVEGNTPPKPKINARELIVEQPKIDYEEEFGILTSDLEKNGINVTNNIYNFKDEQLRNRNLNQLLELSNKYPHNIVRNKDLTLDTSARGDNNYGSAFYEEHEIRLNANHYSSTSKVVEAEKKDMESGWHYKVSDDKADIYTITHEYGHIVEFEYLREARENARRSGRRFNFKEKDKDLRDTLISRAITISGKKMNTQYFKDMYFSGYAKSKRNYEWFAELFAQSQLGEQTPFTQALLEWLEVRYK